MTSFSGERWERAKAIVADALEISSTAERQTYVARECGGDEELRTEVESLLAQLTTGFDQVARNSRTEDALSNGRRIGRYEIVRELGRGGMGAVYLARRADGEFDQEAAVKLLKRGTDTDEILRHFQAERQILARLKHPSIAHLLDAGTTEDGLPYFVMEYVEGVPLNLYASEKGLSVTERLELFQQVCAAISYAHRNLVVHRDLKPSNVLVTNDGEVKLLDFGIAKLLQASEQEPDVTLTVFRVMTPEYASPEQLNGDPITTLSDVYSLGVLLYELLTGTRPYRLKTRRPEEIAQAVTNQGPPKLLRGDLDNICGKALRKEPERRYPSVDELTEDIRRHLHGLPVRARKDTAGYRAWKFIRRHQTGVAAAALVFLALIAGLIGTIWQARRAETRFNQVRSLAHSVLFSYHDKIAALPGSTEVREELVRDALAYLDNLSSEAGGDKGLLRELAAAYEKVGQIQGNSYYANLGDAKGAMISYQKSVVIRDRLLASESSNVELQKEDADAHEGMGDMHYTLGDLTTGLANYDKARALRESVVRARPTHIGHKLDLSQLYTKLGDIKGMEGYDNLGDPAGAVASYRQAQELIEPLAAASPNDSALRLRRAEVLSHLSMLYDVTGEVALALGLADRATTELEKLCAEEPNNSDHRYLLLTAYAMRRYALVDTNQLDRAIAQSEKVAAELEAMAAQDPKNMRMRRGMSVAYNALGIDLLKQGETRGALQRHRDALVIDRTLLNSNPESEENRADLAFTLRRLGEAQAAAGDTQAALENFQQALTYRQQAVASNPSNARARDELSAVQADMGKALAKNGATHEAEENLSQAVSLAKELSRTVPTHVKYRASLGHRYRELGQLYLQMHDWTRAASCLQQSLGIWNELPTIPAEAPEAAQVREEIARAEQMLTTR